MAAIGAVLLLILQIIGWVLLVVLGIVCVVLIIPTCVALDYHENVFSAKVGMLCFLFQVYPRPPKGETAAKDKVKPKKPKPKKEKVKKPPFGLMRTIEALEALCCEAGAVLRLIIGALRITDIRLHVPVHGKDAADTAIQYGKINAGLYSTLGVLNRFLYLDFKELRLTPIFEENFDGYADFSCKISAQLFIMVVVLFRLLNMLRKEDAARAFVLRLAGGKK